MSTKRSHPRLLGRRAELPASPDKAALDRVPNPHPDTHYAARFTAPEFTTLCPVTGQPDFAHLVIDYVPDRWLVESKSLKLYLASAGLFSPGSELRKRLQPNLTRDPSAEDALLEAGIDLARLARPNGTNVMWLRPGRISAGRDPESLAADLQLRHADDLNLRAAAAHSVAAIQTQGGGIDVSSSCSYFRGCGYQPERSSLPGGSLASRRMSNGRLAHSRAVHGDVQLQLRLPMHRIEPDRAPHRG